MLERKLYINGTWTETKSGSIVDDLNPADGSVVAKIHMAGPDEVKAAIDAADKAFHDWSSMLATHKDIFFFKAADHLEANIDRYAQWLIEESGSSFMKAMDEIKQSAYICRAAGGECRKVNGGIIPADQPNQLSTYIRQPLGIIGGIAPFNYPLLLAITKVMLAMAAGNTFILKPASDTPLSAVIIAEACEAAGFPAGVFNILPGPGRVVGDGLINDPRVRMITFTGSTEVGLKLGIQCTERLKRVTLEMGGKNPMIILKDANLQTAVNAASFGCFFHQGQICMATSRLVVEEPVYDTFCEMFVKKAKALKVGDPHDHDTIVGPLIKIDQCYIIDELIKDALDKGARLLTGGTHEGTFYQPTVIADVTRDMRIFQEECFGPVEIICKAKDTEDALSICNDNIYGLSAALMTENLALALTLAPRIQAGMVHVNDATVMGSRQCPFGGVKNSGMGREGSNFSIEEFTELKWITYGTAPASYPTDMYN